MITARVRFAGALLFLVFSLYFHATAHSQCITPELVMINSCIEHPNPNGGSIEVESEIIIMRTGLVPVAVNTIGVDLPFNGFGPQNGDLGYDLNGAPLECDYKFPTVTSLPGCPGAIPAGPDDEIPADAFVVLFLTGTTVTEDVADTDFTNICAAGRPVYILQSACERTTGAFANGPGQGDPLRTISISSPCGLRISTYNTSELDPANGTYYLVGTSETGNQNCDFPVIPPTCLPTDTALFLCVFGSTVDPPVPVTDFEALFSNDVLLVSFHDTPQQAELNQNRITDYSGDTDGPDTLYTRLIYDENLCVAVGKFIVRFPENTSPAMSTAEPLRGCDPTGMGVGVFNLRLADLEIGSGSTVNWYLDPAATQEIADPENFSSSGNTVYAATEFRDCRSQAVPIELALSSGPATIVMTDPTSCAEVADGTVFIQTAGFEPFTYDWENDVFDGGSSASGLAPGVYNLTVTDRYGCSSSLTPIVEAGLGPQISCTLVQPTSGPAIEDGVVEISFSNGSGPYRLTYTGAAAGAMDVNGQSVQLTGLPSGDYAFTATDAVGCETEMCLLELPFNDQLVVQCRTRSNSNDVSVLGTGQVELSGGTPPYLVRVTDENGNSSNLPSRPVGITVLPNLPAGEYTVTVTDASGATETCTINIALVVCSLTIVDVQQLATDCSGTNNTVIRLTVAGGEGPITTVWGGGNGIEAFNGMQEAGPLPPGVYFVTVGDQSSCPGVSEGPIIVSDPGMIEYTVGGDFSASPCQDDARIEVTLTGGGIPPYSVVLFDRNSMTEFERITNQPVGAVVSFTGLAGGGNPDFAVYVVDDLGCESDRTFSPVTADPDPSLELNPADQQLSPPTCEGDRTGVISLLATGGTGPYGYRWIGYPQLSSGRVLADGPGHTNLPAGNYEIEITDANGCQDTATVVLPEGNPRPTIACGSTTGSLSGPDGTVALSLSAGIAPYTVTLLREGMTDDSPNLAGPDETITNLPPGDYRAYVTDARGCVSDTCTFNIPLIACALRATALIDTIFCAEAPEGGISVTMAGGVAPYGFSWGPGVAGSGADVNVFAEGDFPVTIEDANGCTLDTSFFVPNLMLRTRLVLETPRFLPACPGEDVRIPLELEGVGPFMLEYLLNPGPGVEISRVFTTSRQFDTLVIPASDFVDEEVLVSSRLLTGALCESRINQTFSVRYSAPDTIRRTESTCDPGPLEIGGRFFDAQNPADTFLLDDGSACGVMYEVNLDFLGGGVPDTILVPICPATPYEENGEVFDAARPEGEVRYARPGRCDSIVYIRLDILPEFVGSYTDNACVGDTIFYADRFFTAENTSGLARLPGMAATGCDSLVFVNTSFRRTGEVRLFGDFEICPGDSIELRFTYDGPGGIDVVMTDLAGNIINLENIRQGSRVELFPGESTSYRLLSSGTGGCPGEVAGSSSVIVNDLSVGAEVLLDPGDYCQDTLGLAAATYAGGVGPYAVAWSNGPADSINRNLLAGTYRVSVTDAIGCTLTDSVVLTSLEPLTARVMGVPPVCPGENGSLRIDTIFGGGGFYEVSVDGQFFLPVEFVRDIRLPPGNHRAVFQGANDCSATVNFSVADALDPTFDLPTDTTIFLGDSIFLDGSLVNQDSAWWTPQTALSTPNSAATWASPQLSFTYTLHLRTLAQCIFTHEVNITVDERLPVYAPTAFSPNGDGFNDLYELGLGRSVRALKSFQIFNRWGNLMHDAVDGWDGEFARGPAPPAVYVFQAVVEMADGSERFVKGDFVLMR